MKPMTPSDASSVLIIGESIIDLVAFKSMPEVVAAHPGGSPMNVAVTVGRLGHRSRLATQLAPDEYGKQIVAHLRESNVDFVVDPFSLPATSTAVALVDDDGSASYRFNLTWNLTAPPPLTDNPGIVHTGSVAATLLPGAATVLEMIRRSRIASLITYDPNIRPSIMPPRRLTAAIVEEHIRLADLVKVSDQDLKWLYPQQSTAAIIDHWFMLGSTQIIVVTSGNTGAAAWTRNGNTIISTPFPVRVVDTVGAGDSFMGGLISQMLARNLIGRTGARRLGTASPQELAEILWEANRVASITVSRAGANPPWRTDLNGNQA